MNSEKHRDLKYYSGAKCLVTGGAGALGSNLVNTLVEFGAEVMVIDDLSSGMVENLNSIKGDLTFVKGSFFLSEQLEMIESFSPSFIFHLAAHFANQNSVDHPSEDLMTNAYGTLKLLNLCKKLSNLKRFLYASSSCVLGSQNIKLSEKSMVDPETPYGFSKLAGEQYSLFYASEFKLPITVIRFFNVYGPGEYPGKYRNVIPNFVKSALCNSSLIITGTGNETREFVYVSDTINGILKSSMVDETIGEILHLGSGFQVPIIELAKKIIEISNSHSIIEFMPRRSWDNILHRSTSIEKAKSLIDYNPKISINKGLEKTIIWIQSILPK